MNDRLNLIEKDRNVNILFACESGSRAWGFASPDSDYDVRFIYQKPLDWYLKMSEGRDSINILDGDFDAVGWELRKQLRLLRKSNVPALEHLFSPIVYAEKNMEMTQELKAIAENCFSPVACMYHYLSMSKKYAEKLEHEEVKLKDLFYALRTSLAGKWILEHKSMPPVVFSKMLSLVSEDEKAMIENLIALKASKNEAYKHAKNKQAVALVHSVIAVNDRYAKSLPSGKPDSDHMNDFLYRSLMES